MGWDTQIPMYIWLLLWVWAFFRPFLSEFFFLDCFICGLGAFYLGQVPLVWARYLFCMGRVYAGLAFWGGARLFVFSQSGYVREGLVHRHGSGWVRVVGLVTYSTWPDSNFPGKKIFFRFFSNKFLSLWTQFFPFLSQHVSQQFFSIKLFFFNFNYFVKHFRNKIFFQIKTF